MGVDLVSVCSCYIVTVVGYHKMRTFCKTRTFYYHNYKLLLKGYDLVQRVTLESS